MDKPTVIRLDITDLRRAVDDAAFRALVEKGWTVITSVVISDEEGQHIHIVMVPPRDVGAAPVLATISASWTLGVVLGVFACLGFSLLVN